MRRPESRHSNIQKYPTHQTSRHQKLVTKVLDDWLFKEWLFSKKDTAPMHDMQNFIVPISHETRSLGIWK